MSNRLRGPEDSVIGLERPRFGEFARQVAAITTGQIANALSEQKQRGGPLGEILVERGLLAPSEIREVLALQARWVASTLRHDLGGGSFPYPAFLSLCLPAYNEAENIESCLDSACAILPELVREWEVVVVNDGSKDNTGEIVRRYSEREPHVRLVEHPQNRGYGGAVTSGLRAARGDLIVFTDGDGQFSMLDLPQLLTRLDGCDLVIGYRYQRADKGIRKLNAWGWNQLVRLTLGVQVRDLDCAFKLFRREVVDRLSLTATGACINAEIMAQCIRANLKLCEVPVTHYPRYHGAPTGANFKVILKAFRELPRLRKYRAATLPPPAPVPASVGQQTAA